MRRLRQATSESSTSLRCSFCGKQQLDVTKMVVGDHGTICDECIRVANEMLEDEDVSTDP